MVSLYARSVTEMDYVNSIAAGDGDRNGSSTGEALHCLDTACQEGRVPMAVGGSSCYQNNSKNGNHSSCYYFFNQN